jgi:hypothetical protein
MNLIKILLQTDKASMLDEVIEYLKQLQAQVHMVNRFNMSPMMMPMTMQQQLQMSMMNPMGMGMGMGMAGMGMGMGMPGMGMDMNAMNRANIPGMPQVLHPSAFMPMASWDAGSSSDRLQGPPPSGMADPISKFFGCQSQVSIHGFIYNLIYYFLRKKIREKKTIS